MEAVNFQKIVTDIVQTAMKVYGPNLIYDKTKKFLGFSVDRFGFVSSLPYDEKVLLQHLYKEYLALSEKATYKIFENILKKHNLKVEDYINYV